MAEEEQKTYRRLLIYKMQQSFWDAVAFDDDQELGAAIKFWRDNKVRTRQYCSQSIVSLSTFYFKKKKTWRILLDV